MKTVLVTGGSGFIGRNIAEQMGGKYRILAPRHADLELLDEDAVRRYFAEHEIEVVVHSAVRPGHRNAKDLSNQLAHNTRMFFNIVRNAKLYKKLIFLGSGLGYDIRHYIPKMKEEYFDMHVPVDEGGLSKYIISKIIEKSDNMVELRVFGIFGKHEDYAIRFISNAICKTLFDLPITLKQNRRFDYIYVNDFIPILEYFIDNEPKYKAYNITPDESIELLALAEHVRRISGKDLPIRVGQEGMGAEYSGDNSRLRDEIPSLSFMPIDMAIRELYTWYEGNVRSIDKECLLIDK